MAGHLQEILVWAKEVEFGTARLGGVEHLYARILDPETGYDVRVMLTADTVRRLIPQLEAMRDGRAGLA